MIGAEVGVMCLKDGGRDHERRNAGGLQKLGKARNQLFR